MIRSETRNRLHRLSRRGLAVLVALSLNLAAIPCSMAIEAGESNAHCPSVGAREAGHDDSRDVPMPPECIMMQSDCCKPGEVPPNKRRGVDKNPDQDLPVYVAAEPRPRLHAAVAVADDTGPPDPDYRRPPLHKLLCVYLD